MLWPLMSFAGAAVVIGWPWLSGDVTIPWDAKATFQPQIQFLAQALATDQSPFWTPYVFSGYPQVADPQAMIFSPPFLLLSLITRAPSLWAVDMAVLAMVFVGGAVGKFACGALADRVGTIRTVVITEAATGAGILLLLTLSLSACFLALVPLGIALNGTSSVLYGTVADLVSSNRRARSYAIFYTLGIGASALSPFLYGLLSDWAGVHVTLAVVGCVVFLTLPFTLPLRQPITVASPQSA